MVSKAQSLSAIADKLCAFETISNSMDISSNITNETGHADVPPPSLNSKLLFACIFHGPSCISDFFRRISIRNAHHVSEVVVGHVTCIQGRHPPLIFSETCHRVHYRDTTEHGGDLREERVRVITYKILVAKERLPDSNHVFFRECGTVVWIVEQLNPLMEF